MARNLALSERRRVPSAPAGPEEVEELEERGLEVSSPDPLLRARIGECHGKLPRTPARALDARLANAGREPDELLAARLSMRTNTFVQNVARARRFMAECLESQGILLTEISPGG